MKCERAQEWFSSYIDGSLGPAQAVVLESHLSSCEACMRDVEGLRQVWAGLHKMPQVEAPASLRALIWQRIQAAEEQTSRPSTVAVGLSRRRPLWARMAVVGAMAALVIVMAQVTVPGRYRTAGLDWLLGRTTRPATGGATLTVERAYPVDGKWAASISLRVPKSFNGAVAVSLQDAKTGDPLGEAIARVAQGKVDATVEATRRVRAGTVVRVTVRDMAPRPSFDQQTAIVR